MNHALIGVSGALGVCVLVLLATLLVVTRRGSRRGEQRVDAAVGALESRLDELARELQGAVDRAEEEGRRSRFLGSIAGTIDLEEVLARSLEAASALPGADAALIRLDAPDGKPVVAAAGIAPELAERQAVAGPPDGRRARAVELSYRYAGEPEGDAVRGGLAVPFEDEHGPVGHLAIFTREPGRGFDEQDVRRLEELAVRAGPAIENARRFKEARQQADLDALTGLHNRRYFHETLEREIARAHRYGRQLAIVVFDLDGFKEINDRIGHLGGDAVLAEASERVREVVRSADVPCRVGGDEFAVIVPEAGREEAQRLVARIESAVSSRPLAQAGRVRLSAGIAELQPEDDPISLFERADSDLYATKETRKRGGLSAADAPA